MCSEVDISSEAEGLKRYLGALAEMSMRAFASPQEGLGAVVRTVAACMDVPTVCVSRIEGEAIRFLCVYDRGAVAFDAGSCPLDVTPCATVMRDKAVGIFDWVVARFPKATFLSDRGADAYCGVPSLGRDGEVVAVTCLLDDRPREFSPEDVWFLRIVAERIGAECRRIAGGDGPAHATTDVTHVLESILAIASEGIIVADEYGRIVRFNKGAEAIFGWTEAEVAGRTLDVLMPGRFHARHARHLADFKASREVSRLMGDRGPVLGVRRDGNEFILEASIAKLSRNGGRMFTAILRDVTERRRLEASLLDARRSAEASSRAKSDFLANMGHELRTPLNAIIGFSTLIREKAEETPGGVKYSEYARYIRESGESILAIVNDILEAAKADLGTMTLAEEVFDAGVVLQPELSLYRSEAKKTGIAFDSAGVPALGPVIAGDARKFRRAVANLLSNAVKFTTRGGSVTVATSRDANGDYVCMIADTGMGMTAVQIERALEWFQQLDTGLSRRHGGLGLGMPFAKAIADMHGGALSLESEPAKGTVVSLRLPASRVTW